MSVTFTLVLIMTIGTIERAMPNELACNRAVLEAPMEAAKHGPETRVILAECRRT